MSNARFSRRDVLGAAAGALPVMAAMAGPLKAGTPEANAASPASWVDPAMPDVSHRMVEANGIRLHVAEQGTGPLVALCHGFPECWYSWRHQFPALAAAGFRAVALDLRGYGRSDRPEEVEKYTLLHDIGDVVGLLDTLGVKQAVIAGHDVGATVAWQAALLRPDRFRGVMALSPPFRPRAFGASGPPTTLMPRNEDAVFYQLFLQTPEAEAALGRDLRRTFRSQFYSLSGDRPPSTGASLGNAGMVPRKGAVLTDPTSLPAWVTEADIDVYVAAYTSSGWRGPWAGGAISIGAGSSWPPSTARSSACPHFTWWASATWLPPCFDRTSRGSPPSFQSSGGRSCCRAADIGRSRNALRTSAPR